MQPQATTVRERKCQQTCSSSNLNFRILLWTPEQNTVNFSQATSFISPGSETTDDRRMHTVLTRLNALVAYAMSVLAALTLLCFLSTFFLDYSTHAQIDTVNVVVKHVSDYSSSREKNDLGFLTFDLHADLAPLFNWNVKQVFLYLSAEYSTPKNAVNQVVLWDKIIQTGEPAMLDYKSMNTKYYFWDDGNGLKNHQNVTLTLSWNVIPNAGNLPRIMSTGKHSFKFPAEYTSSRA